MSTRAGTDDLGLGDINDLAAEAVGGGGTGGESAAAVAEPEPQRKPPTSPEGEERERKIEAARAKQVTASSRVRIRLVEVRDRIAAIGDPFKARQEAVARRTAAMSKFEDTIKLLETQQRRLMTDANIECEREQERAQWTAEELQLLKQEQDELLRSQAGEIEASTAVNRSNALAERSRAARDQAASIK